MTTSYETPTHLQLSVSVTYDPLVPHAPWFFAIDDLEGNTLEHGSVANEHFVVSDFPDLFRDLLRDLLTTPEQPRVTTRRFRVMWVTTDRGWEGSGVEADDVIPSSEGAGQLWSVGGMVVGELSGTTFVTATSEDEARRLVSDAAEYPIYIRSVTDDGVTPVTTTP